MRIGLIGGGNISGTHGRAAAAMPGVEVVAIYGENDAKVAALAAEFHAQPYRDFAQFLAHPMDLVAIGSPSGLHAQQGIAAARRGLHVIAEKPIDIATACADALIAECDKAGVKLGVFFQDRFKPELVHLKQSLGALGPLHLVDGRVKWYRPPEYYGSSRWRGTWELDGGGAVINQGIHTLDLMVWLAGDITRVFAQRRTAVHKIEAEDTCVAAMEFKSGAVGTFEAATSAYPGFPRRVELTGATGTAVIEADHIAAAELLAGTFPPAPAAIADQNPSTSSAAVSDIRGHQAALEDFLDAIRQDRTPRCDGREARRSLAVVEAIYRSAQTGDPVEV